MLSTAHHVHDGDQAITGIYKSCQPTNRFSQWVQESDQNYLWLHALCVELNSLYKEQRGHDHGSGELLPTLTTLPVNIPKGELTPVPIAEASDTVTHIYQVDAILGHREYMCEKFDQWAKRPVPKIPRFKTIPAWLC